VTSRPGTAALRVDVVGGELVRHRIEPELLGSDPARPRGPASLPVPDDVRELRELRQAMRR
jgi:dipeptidase E